VSEGENDALGENGMAEVRPADMRILMKAFDPPAKGQPPYIRVTRQELTAVSRDPGTRKRFLEGLELSETDIDYSELLYAFRVISTREEVEHLQKHWYGKGPGSSGEWFREFQPIKAKTRAKMVEAFRLSFDRNLPVVVYWVTPVDCVDHMVIPTDTQISVFRFTPLPPRLPQQG